MDQCAVTTPSSPKGAISLHTLRLNHTPSKLPAFRFGDLNKELHFSAVPSLLSPDSCDQESALASASTYATAEIKQGASTARRDGPPNTTASTILTTNSPPKVPSSSPERPANQSPPPTSRPPSLPAQPTLGVSVLQRAQDRRARRGPASHSCNGIETFTGPPPALSTQRSFAAEPARIPTSPTTVWALAQQELAFQSLDAVNAETATNSIRDDTSTRKPPNQEVVSKSLDESTSKPRIPPIRGFRSSSMRATLDMSNRAPLRFDDVTDDQENDRDRTLRALEGFSDEERHERIQRSEQEERRQANEAPTEDLFFNLARDDMDQANENGEISTGSRRRSRIALASHRQSLPPTSSTFLTARIEMPRHGSDVQGSSPLGEEQTDRLAYRRNRPTVSSPPHLLNDLNRSRHTHTTSQYTPTTPRTLTGRETTYPSPMTYGGRKPSVPDNSGNTPQRLTGYRQSNLSYGTTSVYNSSPLVGRSMEVEDGLEIPQVADGTESTTSTTAPSTVWDELDDLKSRIRKLELTGKLPATSGAAVSQATGDRPPTATTTITTMSTSPKRGRGLSISPVDSTDGSSTAEVHPLLQSALAKSKPLVSAEVYKALEATASDALTIAAMIGTTGQPGPISSSQSTIGGGSAGVTDRQLRRKVDGMCRSLTELCLALSEELNLQSKPLQPPQSQALVRPISMDREYPESPRAKSSPRGLSRMEARRSTLLGNSSLPSPRYVSSSNTASGNSEQHATPSQAAFTSRRASLMLRNRRAGTEDPEEDETRFRAPSRAVTEIGRIRNSPREYTSREEPPPLPTPGESRVPVRRHYASTSLGNGTGNSSPATGLSFLDRGSGIPERNVTSVVSKLVDDRGQRSFEPRNTSGVGLGRTGSLGRQRITPRMTQRERVEDANAVDGGYQ